MIKRDQSYTTRDGLEVIIYAIYEEGKYPVHGAIFRKGEWEVKSWTLEGFYTRINLNHEFNLVEKVIYKDWPIDAKVIYHSVFGKFHKHFAGVSEDRYPMIFSEGLSSWTTDCKIKVAKDSLTLADF